MNADAATRALVHAVQPLKIIFLVDVGGLLDDNGTAHRVDQPRIRL